MFEWLNLLILPFAVAGLWMSIRILSLKRKPEPVVCYLGGHCDTVVKSKFSTVFGIPQEYIGVSYFAIVVLFLLLHFFGAFGLVGDNFFPIILLWLGAFGAFYALLLLSVQIFILKDVCENCVVVDTSAIALFIIESLVFVLGFSAYGRGIAIASDLLGQFVDWISL